MTRFLRVCSPADPGRNDERHGAVLRHFRWAAGIFPLVACLASSASTPRPDIVIGDFEGATFGDWSTTGDAFGSAPFRPGDNPRFHGKRGDGLAFSGRDGTGSRGTLLSPEFSIQRPFINFLIAGNRDLPTVLGIELIVGGRVVRAGAGTEGRGDNSLRWRSWAVGEWIGQTGRIRANDNATYGALTVDHITQGDERNSVCSDATTLFQETFRPQFHYTARTGWINDANGMVHYKGCWHLFHQHRPPGSPATVWGHAASDDLLHWRHLPTAIPCEENDAIFSGSGLVDWENASSLRRGDDPPLLFFFTLHPDAKSGRKATQCMAYSTDGARTFEKFSGNPILSTRDNNDRDPKVFWHKPTRAWFMVLSLSRNNADREHATYGLFRSEDLRSWTLLQEIGPGAWYWECPDMFEMAVDGDPARTKWLLAKGSGDYVVGTFDGTRFTPETSPIRTQWGGSYYGAQTFSDTPGGRRVQIGWMNSGPKTETPNAYPGMPFNQQMSFPRELTLRTTPDGPRLFRQPVPEIEMLYAKEYKSPARALNPGDNPLAGIGHDLLDIDLEMEPQGADRVSLVLRGEEIIYEIKDAKLKAFGRTLSLPLTDGKLALRALLDRASIELFGNRGEVTHSGVFFPDPSNRSLSLTVSGGQARLHQLIVRELGSIFSEGSARAKTTKIRTHFQ